MKKSIPFLIIGFIIIPINILCAQNLNQDSLMSIWNDTEKPDSVRLKACYEIAKKIRLNDPDSAINLLNIMMNFAESRNNLVWEGILYNAMGAIIQYLMPSKAISYYNHAIKIKKQLNDSIGLGIVYSNLSSLYWVTGDFPKAFETYQKQMEIFEKKKYYKGLIPSYINIGLIYWDLKEYDKAFEFEHKGFEIAKEHDPGNLSVLGASCNNMALIKNDLAQYDEALNYNHKALEYFEQINWTHGLGWVYYTYGLIYTGLDREQQAMTNLFKSISKREEINDTIGLADTYSALGNLYLKQEKYDSALQVCKKGFQFSQIINDIDSKEKNCKCLNEAYKGVGDFKNASLYFDLYLEIKDSLNRKRNAIEVARLEMQYEHDKKQAIARFQHERQMQTEKTRRYFLMFAGIIVLIVAISLWRRLIYTRKSKAAIQSEKERSDELLLNILPSDIALELKDKGHSKARNFDKVSILFSDFKEFTQVAEQLSAEELVKEIDYCFGNFDEIIVRYGIEKIKTIGDAYMAAAGLPNPSADSAINLVRAALEMQSFMASYKSEKIRKGKPYFEMRIGIHTGPVVAGIVGVKKFQYDIWGDTVNIASRMESSGDIGKVNISQATYAMIKDRQEFSFEFRGEIEAKNKGKLKMYFVSEQEV